MRTHDDYNTGTIQQKCGYPEPTEASLKSGVDEGFRAAFARKGRKMPNASSHIIGDLSEEAQAMIEAY